MKANRCGRRGDPRLLECSPETPEISYGSRETHLLGKYPTATLLLSTFSLPYFDPHLLCGKRLAEERLGNSHAHRDARQAFRLVG